MLLSPIVVRQAPPPLARASTPEARGITASSTAHGLKMTLALPRRSYPRGALVRAALTFRNVSSHALYYDVTGGDAVLVLNGRGSPVYQTRQPLGMGTLLAYKGPQRTVRLLAGQSRTDHIYLVLYGRFITAETGVSRAETAPSAAVRTPRISIHLTSGSAPEASITTTPHLSVTVTPRQPVSGKLHYLFETSCTTSDGTGSTRKGWTSTTGRVVTPIVYPGNSPQSTCSGTAVWNGLAGWLNHPVATFRYRTPGRQG